jgi:hypothetical protein
MKVHRAFALSAAVLVAAGCGASGLETGAGTVEKKTAEAFLTTADADWHQQVDAEPIKNLSPDGRCYFVTDADGNKSLGTIACGPLRRLGTAEGQVWDIARVEPTGGDKPGVRIPEDQLWSKSQAKAAGSQLWRPDDQKAPEDADTLAAPPAPAAKAGMTEVGDRAYTLDLKPATDKLVVPDGTVTLKGVASPALIGSGADALAPASGEKFVVATFTTSSTVDQLTGRTAIDAQNGGTGGAPSRTTWTVTVGTEQRPVQVLPAAPAFGEPAKTTDRTIVASVPKDASEVLLTAANGTVTQSLSLITGRRTTTDTAAAYYRTSTQVALNKSLGGKTVNQGRDFRSTYRLTFDKAVLTSWDPEHGWAPAGKAWVRVKYESELSYNYAQYLATWNKAFLTATADGVPVPTGENGETHEVASFLVPATVKTVELKASPSVTYTGNSYSLHNEPKSGSATYGTLTAAITFQ